MRGKVMVPELEVFVPDGHPGWVDRKSGPNFTVRRKNVGQRPTIRDAVGPYTLKGKGKGMYSC